jgi:MFS family permease
LPLLGFGYLFNFIDRTNIGFASLQMNDALGLRATQFGLAAGLFYVGYCLVEVPSNIGLHRFGARVWLARIMISWGLLSSATAAVVGPNSFYALRVLCGIAEAGFFPGVVYFLSTWFPIAVRTRILAWFMLAIPLSSVVSGPLSTALLGLDGRMGLAGWQWLFLVEGLPACALGIVTLRALPDTPRDASWLSSDEKAALEEALRNERSGRQHENIVAALLDPRVLLLSLAYFCSIVGASGIGIWLPQMLKDFGLSTQEIGVVAALPYLLAAIAMILWARFVDRSRRYLKHYVFACLVAAAGFGLSMISPKVGIAMLGITIAVTGVSASRAPFFSIPPRFLAGAAAAGGVALINSFGNLGGFVGPYVMGWLKDYTGSFTAGLALLSAFLLASALLSLLLVVLDRPAIPSARLA